MRVRVRGERETRDEREKERGRERMKERGRVPPMLGMYSKGGVIWRFVVLEHKFEIESLTEKLS